MKLGDIANRDGALPAVVGLKHEVTRPTTKWLSEDHVRTKLGHQETSNQPLPSVRSSTRYCASTQLPFHNYYTSVSCILAHGW